MACWCGNVSEEQKRGIEEIKERDKQQKEDAKRLKEQGKIEKDLKKKTHKVLLLGTGGGGKTTFLNQMKIILNGDDAFSRDVRTKARVAIFNNIFKGVRTLIVQMEELRIRYEKSANRDIAAELKRMDFQGCLNRAGDHLSPNYIGNIRKLWMDTGIQRCFSRRNEFTLQDTIRYFLDRLDDIASPDYLPSNDDILRMRNVTEVAYESEFRPEPANPDVRLKLIDVGGQRPLRKLWLPHFDDVTSIIFITSLAEWDQTLAEDENVNRCEESISLFKTILKIPEFKKIPVILFLNKKDLLEEKLEANPTMFKGYFPDFDADDERLVGEANSTGERKEALYLRDLYLMQKEAALAEDSAAGIPRPRKKREVYTHITQATDRENITRIWNDIKEIILMAVIGTAL